MSAAKAAARYIKGGYAVVPVPAGEKNPGRDGWQNLRIRLEDIPSYFNNGQNIGLHCGEPSGWTVCADLDTPEVQEIADRFLEPTLTSGRESTPESHRWYVAVGTEHRTFKALDNSMILELRSTGHHTLVAPSTHPEGESYRWSQSGREIATADARGLTRRCQALATAALIAQNLPETRKQGGGGRHEIALALCGFLLRRQLPEETVLEILRGGWDAKGYASDARARREAHRDLEGIVRDTSARLGEGKPATGGKRLEDLIPGLRRRIADYWGWSGRLDDETAEEFHNTELGNSRRLIAWEGGDLRYCYPWGRWLVWTGINWLVDDRGEVLKRAKNVVSKIYQEAAQAPDDEIRKMLAKHAMSSESERKIRAMVELAKPEVAVLPDELDADKWKLNVQNGTINLRNGKLLEHNRADLMTKVAPVEYDPFAEAPLWRETLERVLPNDNVRAFFQRLCGYALVGEVSEHILPVLYGTGANGKSTVLNALLDALGDYSLQAAPDLLIAKRGAHPTELADLFGMRLVASIEVEDGRRFAESLVKQLTGGDRVRARRMRQDFWEFDPTHTVLLATNHKPEVRGTDNAIWRRIRLIPFTETIPDEEQDKQLPEKLRGELAGILAWAMEGCLEWQQDGLQAPDEVLDATGEYRSEMDVTGAFLDECCVIGDEESVSAADLYKAYGEWCRDTGEYQEKQRKFGSKLTERQQFERYRGGKHGASMWRGVDLTDPMKLRISRDSDLTDPQVSITGSKNTLRGVNDTLGSEGSEGSVNPLLVGQVTNALRKPNSGPAKALGTYLEQPGAQRLEWLTRAVLTTLERDPAGWKSHAEQVRELAADPDNHPPFCECGECQ